MDIAFDTTWCPVCSRQILPKRLFVPINPAPAPPPSSPTSQPKADTTTTRLPRTKTGTIRARGGGGLVHGTGRVKPNGTIKRSDPSKEDTPKRADPAPQALTTRPPVRHRTVIDQSPVPLYCSDECRLQDMQNSFDAFSLDHNPARAADRDGLMTPPLPPAPHNSFSDGSLPDESDSSSGTSFDSSCRQYSSSSEDLQIRTGRAETHEEKRLRGYEALASIYGLPPLPPPPPLIRSEPVAASLPTNDYQSGVMMAARRMKAVLCPEQPKKTSFNSSTSSSPSERKPIPGWTDGSNAWRSSVYSFAAPPKEGEHAKYVDERDPSMKAYRSSVASPHRSHGVYSTMGDAPTVPPTPTMRAQGSSSSVASMPAQRSRSEAEELYTKYPMTFARRSESRSSFSSSRPGTSLGLSALSSSADSIRSLPPSASVSSRRREVPILKKGAEGKLLVPDVKMRRIPSGGSSIEGSSWGSTSVSTGVYERKRSPLSRNGSEASVDLTEEEGTSSSVPVVAKRAPAMRSWSYADTFTYPILQLPKKEKRVEKRMVDGEEKEVEVIVEVPPEPLKRLFLFPGKPVNA